MNPAFSSLLAALARELDLPGIETRDGDSSCLLGIDDFEVSLRCLSTDQVMIFTVVAPLPARKRDELYAALLDANTFFHQTQGFTLAAREDTGVTLHAAPGRAHRYQCGHLGEQFRQRGRALAGTLPGL